MFWAYLKRHAFRFFTRKTKYSQDFHRQNFNYNRKTVCYLETTYAVLSRNYAPYCLRTSRTPRRVIKAWSKHNIRQNACLRQAGWLYLENSIPGDAFRELHAAMNWDISKSFLGYFIPVRVRPWKCTPRKRTGFSARYAIIFIATTLFTFSVLSLMFSLLSHNFAIFIENHVRDT